MAKQKLKKYPPEVFAKMVGKTDSSQFKRKLNPDGIWRITKHSDSFLNCIMLAQKYNNKNNNLNV